MQKPKKSNFIPQLMRLERIEVRREGCDEHEEEEEANNAVEWAG